MTAECWQGAHEDLDRSRQELPTSGDDIALRFVSHWQGLSLAVE
jgi:hypothetical protein